MHSYADEMNDSAGRYLLYSCYRYAHTHFNIIYRVGMLGQKVSWNKNDSIRIIR